MKRNNNIGRFFKKQMSRNLASDILNKNITFYKWIKFYCQVKQNPNFIIRLIKKIIWK